MFRIPLLHILHNTYSVKFLGKRVLKTKKYIFLLVLEMQTYYFIPSQCSHKKETFWMTEWPLLGDFY